MNVLSFINSSFQVSVVFLLLSQYAIEANGQDLPKEKYINIILENDIFLQDDGGYTNGFAVSWGNGSFEHFAKSNTPSWLLAIPNTLKMNDNPNKTRAISYLLGQTISTPEDISQEEINTNEPPYAGMLIGRVTFYAYDKNITDRLTLALGLVGPGSGAEGSQKRVHEITGSEDPKGWRHQLKNEPVFRIESSKSKRVWHQEYNPLLEFDSIVTRSFAFGNLSSNISSGISIRMGKSLESSGFTATDLPGREVNPIAGKSGVNWSIFVNLLGRYEFNNIHIEGNTFRDSHGLDLRHEQLQISYGLSVNLGAWALLFSNAVSTDRYVGQEVDEKFGSLSLTYKMK